PICQRPYETHQSRWCSYSIDGSVAVCHFVSDGAKSVTSTGGYVHFLSTGTPLPIRKSAPRPRVEKPPAPIDWNALIALYSDAVDYTRLTALAASLGVGWASLDHLSIGYIGDGNWSFPMFNPSREPVGIRTRNEDGSKRSIKG